MVRFMNLPAIRNPLAPTMRQADNCVFYLANNLQKKNGGNFIYGSATYVINPRNNENLWAVSAYDSGAFFQYVGAHFGSHQHYYHLVQAFEKTLLVSFSEMLNRWWANGPVPKGTGASLFDKFPYWEYDHFGALRLPEELLYMIMKFSTSGGGTGYWGKTLGKETQDFMREHRRPLIWGDTEDGGMIIDPTVGNIDGGRITAADVALFKSKWSPTSSFASLYNSVPNHLKFFYRSWDKRAACENQEKDASKQVMGVDGDGNCVYWTWVNPPRKWEPAIDGTCFQSADARAIYSSEAACLAVGKGKWSRESSKGPRSSGHYCQPDANGQYASLDACERGFDRMPNVSQVLV
jgi:hypothetical protein